MADAYTPQAVKTKAAGEVIVKLCDASTTSQQASVDASGRLTVNVNGTVTVADANLDNATLVDNAAFTDGTTRLMMGGFIFDEVAGTALTENDAAAARIDSKRAVVTTIEDATTRGQRATVTASNALKVDGSAVSTAATGVQKVGITGNAGAAMDAAGQNAASPANELLVGGQFNTTPTTVSTGNMSPFQIDSKGNLRHVLMDAAGNIRGANVNASNQLSVSVDNNPVLGGGSNTIGALTANQSVNVNQVAGAAVATAATGIPKVGLTDAAGTGFTANALTNRLPTMDGDASNEVKVQAARTSPVLADPAKTVAISPNDSGLPVILPGVVQSVGNVAGSATTTTCVLTPAQGNTLVGLCGTNTTGSLSISDNNSNTWNTAFSQTGIGDGAGVFYAVNVNSGSTTVTCTAGTSGVTACYLYEVSGLVANVKAHPDGTGGNAAITSTTSTSFGAPGLSPTGPNEIAFCSLMLGANNAATATSPFVSDTQQGATGGRLAPLRTPIPILNILAANTQVATYASTGNMALGCAAFRPVQLGIQGAVQARTFDSTGAAPVTASSTPAGTELAWITRNIPSGTQNVQEVPGTTGGLTIYRVLWPANTTGVNIKNAAGQLYGWELSNSNATNARFVKLYNKSSAPTCGTDTPVMTIAVASGLGGGGVSGTHSSGIAFSLGLGICVTGAVGDSDTTAPTANDVVVNIFYK